MAEVTISMPDAVAAWIEDLVRKGEFASASDYIRHAVRLDRELKDPDHPLTLEDLRDMIAEARAGGTSDKTLETVFEEAHQLWTTRHARVA
ncbi:type II toxin-antitoxin system ParD family antitoxin [uncultured Devosia sp.]|uniref:ribbon-helix-helix domain-containing protein n=1 Tax=uncultured Devosia sp. TaxID=211434 RepID=UPI0035CB107B